MIKYKYKMAFIMKHRKELVGNLQFYVTHFENPANGKCFSVLLLSSLSIIQTI